MVNNAGNIRWAGLPEADADNLESHLAVHVGGSFNTTRAAWPHMVAQGYGRVVMTTSTGMFGLPDNLGYATAKAAVIGMTRSLSLAGAAHGIKINLIAPNAWTRMAPASEEPGQAGRPAPRHMGPELVAPMVAYLAHESCTVSGEIYVAGAGRFARVFIASHRGLRPPPTGQPTDRGRRRQLGRHQRRDRLLHSCRPHRLVEALPGTSGNREIDETKNREHPWVSQSGSVPQRGSAERWQHPRLE